jgi:hypothetical protein
MKLRSLFLFGAGVATGLTIAKKLSADDENIAHGPQRTTSNANPALRALSTGTQRLSDRATVLSLDAIRKARGAIRDRLGESTYDDAAWS